MLENDKAAVVSNSDAGRCPRRLTAPANQATRFAVADLAYTGVVEVRDEEALLVGGESKQAGICEAAMAVKRVAADRCHFHVGWRDLHDPRSVDGVQGLVWTEDQRAEGLLEASNQAGAATGSCFDQFRSAPAEKFKAIVPAARVSGLPRPAGSGADAARRVELSRA